MFANDSPEKWAGQAKDCFVPSNHMIVVAMENNVHQILALQVVSKGVRQLFVPQWKVCWPEPFRPRRRLWIDHQVQGVHDASLFESDSFWKHLVKDFFPRLSTVDTSEDVKHLVQCQNLLERTTLCSRTVLGDWEFGRCNPVFFSKL